MTTNVQMKTVEKPSNDVRRVNCPKYTHTTLNRKQRSFEIDNYETKLKALVGVWEDHPRHQYKTEFRLEQGQLVGYSNVDDGKALASFEGNQINMVIVHATQPERGIDRYRGRLTWNQQCINWEKEDSSREGGWRPTRKWVKIQ